MIQTMTELGASGLNAPPIETARQEIQRKMRLTIDKFNKGESTIRIYGVPFDAYKILQEKFIDVASDQTCEQILELWKA